MSLRHAGQGEERKQEEGVKLKRAVRFTSGCSYYKTAREYLEMTKRDTNYGPLKSGFRSCPFFCERLHFHLMCVLRFFARLINSSF